MRSVPSRCDPGVRSWRSWRCDLGSRFAGNLSRCDLGVIRSFCRTAKSKGSGFAGDLPQCDLGVIRSLCRMAKLKGAKSKGSGLWVHQRSRLVRFGCDSKSKLNSEGLWVRSLSLGVISFSLYAWVRKWFEVKIFTSNHYCPTSLILRSTLKIFSVWPNFSDQPNSLFSGKAFLNLVWSQSKWTLELATCPSHEWVARTPRFAEKWLFTFLTYPIINTLIPTKCRELPKRILRDKP